MTNQEIRKAARGLIRGNILNTLIVYLTICAVVAIAVMFVVITSINPVSVALLCVVALASIFVQIGTYGYHLHMARTGKSRFRDVFVALKNPRLFFRYIGFSLALLILTSLPSAVLYLAIWVLGGIIENGTVILVVDALGSLVTSIITLYLSLRYAQTAFVLLDFPDLTVRRAMGKAAFLMRGKKMKLLGFVFSFLGWMLLCVLTLGLALIYVLAYMPTAMAKFYDSLITLETAPENTIAYEDLGAESDYYAQNIRTNQTSELYQKYVDTYGFKLD